MITSRKRIYYERYVVIQSGIMEGEGINYLDFLTEDEYLDIVKPLFGETGEMVTNKIKEYEDELERYATGGRVNFLDGGDTEYNSLVTKKYIELGGKEGTGMDIDKFAEEYFPKMADGGRIGFDKGTMPKSERWMRDYFFSGKGGYDDRMSYQEFALGPGQELFKRFNKKNGGVMYGKYAKQILSS